MAGVPVEFDGNIEHVIITPAENVSITRWYERKIGHIVILDIGLKIADGVTLPGQAAALFSVSDNAKPSADIDTTAHSDYGPVDPSGNYESKPHFFVMGSNGIFATKTGSLNFKGNVYVKLVYAV